jgi:hypothetical protein
MQCVGVLEKDSELWAIVVTLGKQVRMVQSTSLSRTGASYISHHMKFPGNAVQTRLCESGSLGGGAHTREFPAARKNKSTRKMRGFTHT